MHEEVLQTSHKFPSAPSFSHKSSPGIKKDEADRNLSTHKKTLLTNIIFCNQRQSTRIRFYITALQKLQNKRKSGTSHHYTITFTNIGIILLEGAGNSWCQPLGCKRNSGVKKCIGECTIGSLACFSPC